MKACQKMQEVIEALAQRHGIHLNQNGAHFRLDMPGYDRLCVENIGLNRVAVTHYFEQNGDLIQDPEIVFFVGDEILGWIPIEITQVIGGWRQYVKLSADRSRPITYRKQAQASLAEFAEICANNIEGQGWLDHGVKYKRGPDVEPAVCETLTGNSHRWPKPTAREPSLETLEQWMWEDGGCEATDGCWIEPDGVCQHGHPSWLLRLGLI